MRNLTKSQKITSDFDREVRKMLGSENGRTQE